MKKATGTIEWAVENINIAKGCANNCRYCYANANVHRFTPENQAAKNWTDEIIKNLDDKKLKKKYNGVVMFPSSHDITPGTLTASIQALKSLLSSGNSVLIVTKPRIDCIKSLCNELLEYKDKILFRFTIGSTSSEVLKFWEPNAPTFEERFAALWYAHENGFHTSISCEPFLDKTVEDLVKITRPYVTDSIWIGKANHLKANLTLNKWTDDETLKRANELNALYKSDYKFELYELYKDDALIRWKDTLRSDFTAALKKC